MADYVDIPRPSSDKGAVWIVDGNHPWYDALVWMDQLNSETTKAASVIDMVKQCGRKSTENGSSISYLAIFGHGKDGYQSVGAGKKLEYDGVRSLNYRQVGRPTDPPLEGTAANDIKPLNGLLTSNATILLAGCEVGKGDMGTALLKTISKILQNRKVMGFENNVYWWTGNLIGTLKVVQGSAVSSAPGRLMLE